MQINPVPVIWILHLYPGVFGTRGGNPRLIRFDAVRKQRVTQPDECLDGMVQQSRLQSVVRRQFRPPLGVDPFLPGSIGPAEAG